MLHRPDPALYASITADRTRGEHIAAAYLAAPLYDPRAELAYQAFRDETVRQHAELSRQISLTVSDTDPYALDAGDDGSDPFVAWSAMCADVRENGHLAVWNSRLTSWSPLLGPDVNDMFRAVHDFHGHYMSGRDFSRHGEEAAWTRHSRMYSPLAREAMTTETRGQNSVFIWVSGGTEFPVQKVITMKEWA